MANNYNDISDMRIDKLADLILPTGMLDHFELIRIEATSVTIKGEYHLWLDEKNLCPKSDYESKGYYNETTIQDFPIRGKAVYLHCRRRRWRDKNGIKADIKSAFKFKAFGVQLTDELASFLKG